MWAGWLTGVDQLQKTVEGGDFDGPLESLSQEGCVTWVRTAFVFVQFGITGVYRPQCVLEFAYLLCIVDAVCLDKFVVYALQRIKCGAFAWVVRRFAELAGEACWCCTHVCLCVSCHNLLKSEVDRSIPK